MDKLEIGELIVTGFDPVGCRLKGKLSTEDLDPKVVKELSKRGIGLKLYFTLDRAKEAVADTSDVSDDEEEVATFTTPSDGKGDEEEKEFTA